MEIQNNRIDSGKSFDWGKASDDYAKYRDIYPPIFYKKIAERNLCVKGQKVLDLGTGTGVLPRNMYSYGAEWIGIDISENQIAQARKLSYDLKQEIQYDVKAAEDIDFPDRTFHVITACQCFLYFDLNKVLPKLERMLKKDGSLLLLYMSWLSYEDAVANASENLVLKYNPQWSGARQMKRPIHVPDCVYEPFKAVYQEEYELDVPFTRETWNGRMKACRGIGASLSPEKIKKWEKEHKQLLQEIAPPEFFVKHYAAMLELKCK